MPGVPRAIASHSLTGAVAGRRYRAMLTAPARLGAVVVIQVATADQLLESVGQAWIRGLCVGGRATECQVPGSCLVSVAGCIGEMSAVPRVTWEVGAVGRASRRVVILVAVGVLAAGLGGMAATGAAAAVPATGQASAAVALSSNPVLFGVSAVSGSDAWAVGRQNSTGVFKTLILRVPRAQRERLGCR